jgi:NADH-quinone oxidoreductase subunit E
MNLAKVDEIIAHYGGDQTSRLAILQDIQVEYNYLPRPALEKVAVGLGVPISEVYRMATFFKAFSLQPRGEYVVKVCLGTACHVRGGPGILDAVERTLGIAAGSTTADNKVTLEAVRCVGACALGPIMLVNDQPHGNMTRDAATKIVQGLRSSETPAPEEPAPARTRTAPVDYTGVPPTR